MTRSFPRHPLRALVGQAIFQVAETAYFGEDVILSGRRWGDWAALETEVREGIACIRHMLRSGERPTVEEEEAAAAEFRQARNLYSAEETEAWLDVAGLTVDNWLRYVRRTLLRAKWAGQLPELAGRYPARLDQVRRALKIVGICSGHFGRFAAKLAGRAAVFARMTREGWKEEHAPESPDDAEARGLLGLTREMCQARLRQVDLLERAYQVFIRQSCNPEAVQRLVAARHTDWIRVAYRCIAVKDEATAREAMLCIRDDGAPFGDVARRAGVLMRDETRFLEQAEPTLQRYLLSARKDDLIGPIATPAGIVICQVVDKTLPQWKEADIRDRAEAVLADAATAREVKAAVIWNAHPWFRP